MAFEELLKSTDEWFTRPGPFNGTVVSTRVRFARNFEGRKFPHHASAAEQREIVETVQRALLTEADMSHLVFVRLNEVSSLDRQFLTERQLISAEHAASLGERAVAFDEKGGFSFLINEEDQIRLQAFRSGLNLKEAAQALAQVEHRLSERLPFARHPQYGFLTACPTNLGLAFRASVMVHLPALVYSNRIAQVLQGVAQVGLNVRGLQGETTQVASAFFQISNQSSLGKTAAEIVEHVEQVARQMVEAETQAQKALFQNEKDKIMDRICRELGTLKLARLVDLQEGVDGLSGLRVGVNQKILRGIDLPNLNRLLIMIQPAHLAKSSKGEMNPQAELAGRARLLNQMLKDVESA
jgi:protein arginine kinase